jgi:hypothetical protein
MPSLPTPKIKWAGGGIVLAGVVATVIAVGGPSHVDHGVTTCPLPAYPDASCTGYTGSLTTATLNGDGNLRIDDDFAVVDHMDVAGCIDVRGVGVTVKNSNAQCITTSQSARASDGTNPRLTIEDSTVNCGGRLGPLGSTGIAFENFTALRVEVTDCANGLDMFRNPPCTFAQSGSCNGTSAININHGLGGPHASNVTIRWNLLAGGANALYCPRVSTTHYVVLENHFSTAYSPNVGLFAPSVGCTVGHEVVAKNVYHETGLPITLP